MYIQWTMKSKIITNNRQKGNEYVIISPYVTVDRPLTPFERYE